MSKAVVLVIRGDDVFSEVLRSGGCEVLNLELVRTAPVTDFGQLEEKLAHINEYDGLFFTSPAAAEIFVGRAKLAQNVFEGKIYVLGGRAKKVLERSGLDTIHHAAANTAAELISSFDGAEFAGKKL